METVIYKMPEVESYEKDEKKVKRHDELMAKLGLQAPKESATAINPFMPLNSFERNCMRQICPKHDNLEEYNTGTIPLEALETINYCKDVDMFDEYEIWHAVADPDPLLIGVIKTGSSSWEKNYFLLARWGAEAKSIEDLVKMGLDAGKESLKVQIKKIEGHLNQIKAMGDDYAEQVMKGKESTPYLSISL